MIGSGEDPMNPNDERPIPASAPDPAPAPPDLDPPAPPVRWADRVLEACAKIDGADPDSFDDVRDVWREFAAGTGLDYAQQIEELDASTWNLNTPLGVLLRMAAAGDLTPLADALHAARTPDPTPPSIIQRIADLPETHYAIVGDLFYVCCDGPDNVWDRIRDLTGTVIDRPVGSIFRVDHNADDPDTPTGWKVYAAVGRNDVMVLEPRFVDYPSQLPQGARFAQLDWT